MGQAPFGEKNGITSLLKRGFPLSWPQPLSIFFLDCKGGVAARASGRLSVARYLLPSGLAFTLAVTGLQGAGKDLAGGISP